MDTTSWLVVREDAPMNLATMQVRDDKIVSYYQYEQVTEQYVSLNGVDMT